MRHKLGNGAIAPVWWKDPLGKFAAAIGERYWVDLERFAIVMKYERYGTANGVMLRLNEVKTEALASQGKTIWFPVSGTWLDYQVYGERYVTAASKPQQTQLIRAIPGKARVNLPLTKADLAIQYPKDTPVYDRIKNVVHRPQTPSTTPKAPSQSPVAMEKSVAKQAQQNAAQGTELVVDPNAGSGQEWATIICYTIGAISVGALAWFAFIRFGRRS